MAADMQWKQVGVAVDMQWKQVGVAVDMQWKQVGVAAAGKFWLWACSKKNRHILYNMITGHSTSYI